MKLQLVATGEVFDVPRGLSSALLLLGKGEIIEQPGPAPRVISPKSHWSIVENLTAHGTPYVIHVRCENCKNVGSSSGLTAHRTFRYRHCAVIESVPADIAQRYARMIALSQESKERPRRAPGTVPVI
jgi:hypothetical protein